jgi:glutaredoxin-like protein NrdH
MDWVHVEGEDRGEVKLFALSTCGWCRKTRELLEELKVAYDYKYVDMIMGAEREQVMEDVKQWNPACSFPTIVIKNKNCIVGFKPDKIKEELGYGQ